MVQYKEVGCNPRGKIIVDTSLLAAQKSHVVVSVSSLRVPQLREKGRLRFVCLGRVGRRHLPATLRGNAGSKTPTRIARSALTIQVMLSK